MSLFECKYCNYSTNHKSLYTRHISSEKHKNNVLSEEWELPVESTRQTMFQCIACGYSTNQKNNYDRHINSISHAKVIGIDKPPTPKQKPKSEHICTKCNIIYVTYSGLWRHKRKCQSIPTIKTENIDPTNGKIDFEMMENMMKRIIIETLNCNNAGIQKLAESNNAVAEMNTNNIAMVVDAIKTQSNAITHIVDKIGITNNNTNTNCNNTNQKFNLNFYLNETCKDAMNFNDFMNSIKVTLEDLENTGRLGYVDGISRILVNALKSTDVEKRPLHCTDIKRETVYIKNSDEWKKESVEQDSLKQAIDFISNKNISKINEWKEQHPASLDNYSTESNELTALYTATLGSNSARETSKIINNVLKEVILEK